GFLEFDPVTFALFEDQLQFFGVHENLILHPSCMTISGSLTLSRTVVHVVAKLGRTLPLPSWF
ncbi:MAG: hypothetical protein Q8M86_09595, partial [Syntrophales bacterium]|nr:hypothetical protein [Syntrophales bacterium]